MRFKNINFQYWTSINGRDFENIDKLLDQVDHSYFLKVNKKRSDAAGGGIYDLVIKITEDFTLLDLTNSYIQDGIKVVFGYILKSLFDPIKELFKSNKDKNPKIEKVILNFKDCKIILYEIYPNGIEDNFDEIMKLIFELKIDKGIKLNKYKSIHIPILKSPDSYNICNYRVKLATDETRINFNKSDYFEYWGVRRKKKSQVYSIGEKIIINEMFYTQKGYERLFNKAYQRGRID